MPSRGSANARPFIWRYARQVATERRRLVGLTRGKTAMCEINKTNSREPQDGSPKPIPDRRSGYPENSHASRWKSTKPHFHSKWWPEGLGDSWEGCPPDLVWVRGGLWNLHEPSGRSAAFTPLQLSMPQELCTLRRRSRRAPAQGFNARVFSGKSLQRSIFAPGSRIDAAPTEPSLIRG